MDDHPLCDPQILEALEACRPGSDDLSDPSLSFLLAQLAAHPELDQVYERIQRLDAKLAKSFRDVPVPDGLADRLTASLASAGSDLSKSAETSPALPNPNATSTAPAERRHFRRFWIAVAAMAATVVAAASLLISQISNTEPAAIAYQTAIFEAMNRFAAGPAAADGEPFRTAPADHPFSRDVRPMRGIRWRRIDGFLGRSGVAYDMVAPNGARATLFVIAGAGSDFRTAPEFVPPYGSASAWQDQGLVYVLVAEGGLTSYRQFLNLRSGPIT